MSWVTLVNSSGEHAATTKLSFKIMVRVTGDLAHEHARTPPAGSQGVRSVTRRAINLGNNHSIGYEPARLNEGRAINISLRAFELQSTTEITDYHDQIGVSDGVRYIFNMRLFETSLNDLAAGRINLITFSFGAEMIGETPNLWNAVGCRWSREAPISGRVKGEFKFNMNPSDSRILLRIRNKCRELRALAQRESTIARRLRQLRQQAQRHRVLSREYFHRRMRMPSALREEIRLNRQQLSRFSAIQRTMRDRIRSTASSIQRLKGGLRSGFGRLLSSRIIRPELFRMGRRLLARLIPILNVAVLVNDVLEVVQTLHNLFHGRQQLGIEQGAEEAQENPADSMAEANLDAPDTPSEDSSINEASRGTSERGRVAEVSNEERGLANPPPTASPTLSPPAEADELDEDILEDSNEEAADGEVTESLPGIPAALAAPSGVPTDLELIDFIRRNSDKSLPYFDPIESLPRDMRRGDEFTGLMMVLRDGRTVAGQTNIRVSQVEWGEGTNLRLTFTHPAFYGVTISRDIIRVGRGQGVFTRAIPTRVTQ